jgi:hypothetical protein
MGWLVWLVTQWVFARVQFWNFWSLGFVFTASLFFRPCNSLHNHMPASYVYGQYNALSTQLLGFCQGLCQIGVIAGIGLQPSA